MTKLTLSFTKGKGCINHNNRIFIHSNVDAARIKNNKIYVQNSLEETYKEIFSEEVERYNKNKKPCRQIKNYLEHIKNSKNGEKLFYENIVQVGNVEDMYNSEIKEKAIKILDEYAENFQANNPNLHVFNMVMHLDESTPHLHIDYIPVATGYKNGLKIRNSLDKALKEQGLFGENNKKNNATMNWQNREMKKIEEIMQSFGIEREEKEFKTKHLKINDYRVLANLNQNNLKACQSDIETEKITFNSEKVKIKKTDLEKLNQKQKNILIQEKNLIDFDNALKEKNAELCKREKKIEEIYQEQRNLQNKLNIATEKNSECNEWIKLQNSEIEALNSKLEQIEQKHEEEMENVKNHFLEIIQKMMDKILNLIPSKKIKEKISNIFNDFFSEEETEEEIIQEDPFEQVDPFEQKAEEIEENYLRF